MPADASTSQRARWQFSLRGLMLVMLVVAVAAASASYLAQPSMGNVPRRLIGVLMLLSAPLLLMTLVSFLWAFARRDR